MGMKEEIFSIATALGYDGPTPTSKTKAVHAVAEAVGSGGGGGGDVGYDVTITKTYAVPEQTVTTELDNNKYKADLTGIGDVPQMFADGITSFTLEVDGVKGQVVMTHRKLSNTDYYDIRFPAMALVPTYTVGLGYDSDGLIMLSEMTFENDTASTTHTVSCYYEDVSATTTPEFDIAVSTAVDKTGEFVVRLTKETGTGNIVCDKSFDEINKYFDIGMPIFLYRSTSMSPYIQGTETSSGEDTLLSFVSIAFNNETFYMSGTTIYMIFDEQTGELTGFREGTTEQGTLAVTPI